MICDSLVRWRPQGSHFRSRTAIRHIKACAVSKVSTEASELEAQVLTAIKDVKGRGKEGLSESQQAGLMGAVERLEEIGGTPDPTANPQILDGRWTLLYTSRPGSASPIQRAFTGTEAFKIFQEVRIDARGPCRVNNIVEFGDNASVGVLKVTAEASTDIRPLPGFTPRKGAGLALFGKSSTTPPAKGNMRIDFQFSEAAFDFRALPFKVPYPVPFKYLGDETKGWVDITYMNEEGTFRITRGNKGTLFVLAKSETLVDRLLVAIRDKEEDVVKQTIEQLKGTCPTPSPAQSTVIQGKWRQKWTRQSDTANPLQKALSGQVRNWQILKAEGDACTLENRVDLGFATVRAMARCSAESTERSTVIIDKVLVVAFGKEFEFNISRDDVGWVDWVYVDDRIRITEGSQGSTFVHERESETDV